MSRGVVRLKRVYDPVCPDDGARILVDRLWPRGISRERAAIDLWLKDIAPSPELRAWWHGESGTFDEFAARYRVELDDNPAVDELRTALSAHSVVTLVYAARDTQMNHAVVLRDYL